MISVAIMYALVSIVLVVVAVVVHVNATSLSLPISPVMSILAIVLPVVSFLNAYIHPRVLNFSRASSRLQQLSPFVLQTLQALLTTILATLFFEGVVPSAGLNCVLENEWMQRFKAHDGSTIRRIQDSLECCGFNSVKDRAFPWPTTAPSTCSATYGRSLPCKGPWRDAMQTSSSIDFAVVLAVGVLQIVGLLIMREGTSWWTAWWSRTQVHGNIRRESSRPLLTATASDEEAAPHGRRGSRYGSLNDDGPRVQPSPIREGNAWDV